MSLTWQLAWRFRQGKRANGYISFISASSTLGIALGACVLILLLSVMNGFERELKNQLLSVIPHGELWSVDNQGIEDWPLAIEQIRRDQRVRQVQPFTKATGMLQRGKSMKAVEVLGVDPEYIDASLFASSISPEQFSAAVSQPNGLLLGQGVMDKLGVSAGDKVQLLLPQLSDDLSLRPPRSIWLTVQGGVKVGGELDNHLAVMHLSQLGEHLGIAHGAKGLRIHFDDPFVAPVAVREIGYRFPQHVYLSDWTRTQGHLYQDIQLVRAVVYLALILVIAVACFNIVSTLVMAVNEKQSEIAMLKSMGARESLLIKVFMLQGLINGLIGTLCGVIAGVLLALNLTALATGLESLLGIQFLSGDIYFVDFLPSELRWSEVAITALIAVLLSFVATIYPAKKAASVDPAIALNR